MTIDETGLVRLLLSASGEGATEALIDFG